MPEVRKRFPRGETRPGASPGTARAAKAGTARASRTFAAPFPACRGASRTNGTFMAAFPGTARAEASGACFYTPASSTRAACRSARARSFNRSAAADEERPGRA